MSYCLEVEEYWSLLSTVSEVKEIRRRFALKLLIFLIKHRVLMLQMKLKYTWGSIIEKSQPLMKILHIPYPQIFLLSNLHTIYNLKNHLLETKNLPSFESQMYFNSIFRLLPIQKFATFTTLTETITCIITKPRHSLNLQQIASLISRLPINLRRHTAHNVIISSIQKVIFHSSRWICFPAQCSEPRWKTSHVVFSCWSQIQI